MADDIPQEEEEWLYGTSSECVESAVKIEGTEQDNNDEHVSTEKESEEIGEDNNVTGQEEDESGENNNADGTSTLTTTDQEDGTKEGEAGEVGNEGEEEEDDEEEDSEDSDDDDDGVNVVIGDIKSAPAPATTSFTSSKRPLGPPPDKKGKFSVEDFEGPLVINGVQAQDFSLDSIEEKPWRKPGADITDYFNYGFTEETWRAYCDRQKRLRYESGSVVPPPIGERGERKHPIATSIPTVGSDKYGGQPHIIFPKKFGSHDRGPKEVQRINRVREEPRENTIQVMTADRREYSRKAFDMPPPIAPPSFVPDMSVPPPFPPPSFPPPEYHGRGEFPPFNMSNPPPQYYRDDYSHEDQQWMDSAWDNPGPQRTSTTVVPLTKAPNLPPPPGALQESPKEEH